MMSLPFMQPSKYVHATGNPPSSLTDELQRDDVQRTDEPFIFTPRGRQVRRPAKTEELKNNG